MLGAVATTEGDDAAENCHESTDGVKHKLTSEYN
jgi:hypothetical protein